jgi:type III pantothenate kinase
MSGVAAATTYLLDVGNTRCKLARGCADGTAQLLGSSSTHSTLAEWQAFFEGCGVSPMSRVLGVCVASDAVKATLAQALACAPYWLSGTSVLPQFQNNYQTPHTLGADRYLAAFGASAHVPRTDYVLATFGTATTVDWVRWDAECQRHCFEGGIIVAGLDLMLTGLAQGTAHLPDFSNRAAPALLQGQAPQTTQMALLQGAYLAQAATVQAFLALHPTACLVVTGGRASAVILHLTVPHTLIDQAALAGLARMATLELR